MDGQKGRCHAGGQALIDHAADRPVVGPIVKIDAPCPLLSIDAAVAGYHGAIRQAHDQGRIVLTAIGIDEQPRVAREHGRHAKRGRKRARDGSRADVVADVTPELSGRQTERAELWWQGVAGVIAEYDQTGIGASIEHAIGIRLLGANAGCPASLVHHG